MMIQKWMNFFFKKKKTGVRLTKKKDLVNKTDKKNLINFCYDFKKNLHSAFFCYFWFF